MSYDWLAGNWPYYAFVLAVFIISFISNYISSGGRMGATLLTAVFLTCMVIVAGYFPH